MDDWAYLASINVKPHLSKKSLGNAIFTFNQFGHILFVYQVLMKSCTRFI